ncbi:hypothetical protein [Actinacidiphila sp. ITFR-21]|uniref:hypothetical protein n=1 Tax=Actinacidiphila sp. ITFR-21 TaxID=3075199 RepID=UPI0028897381|nr:hypothetical protein [Streptomyces sp. ITFR-21]WNI15572.1 hypothetical protein RLT57_08550 [Streptomyces sp. ITFR-21]
MQQARDAGTTGTDPEVAAWITAATERITRYTSQLFEPTTVAVVADVAPDGLVILPRRVRTITSVTPLWPWASDPPALPASAYRVSSSAVLGAVDSVCIALGGWDDLVVGAESYNGGWGNLLDGCGQVTVAGSFGYDSPPATVVTACALLAADMQAKAVPSDADAAAGGSGLDVDDEGNNVRITSDSSAQASAAHPSSSTGSAAVDALLAPLIGGGRFVLGGI